MRENRITVTMKKKKGKFQMRLDWRTIYGVIMVIMIIAYDFGTNCRQASENERSQKKRANVFSLL